MAEKILDPADYDRWNEEAQAARLVIENREEAVAAIDEKIETDLELLGSTAIEDRL